MKITVRISDVEIILERSSFVDYSPINTIDGPVLRSNLMNDTILPTLDGCVKKAMELYNLKKI